MLKPYFTGIYLAYDVLMIGMFTPKVRTFLQSSEHQCRWVALKEKLWPETSRQGRSAGRCRLPWASPHWCRPMHP